MSEETKENRELERLILFFSKESKGHITKTQLLKMIYLADLYSMKWTGEALTDMDWRLYRNGPWSIDYDEALDALQESGYVVFVESGKATLIQTTSGTRAPTFDPMIYFMLENIRQRWAGSGPQLFQDLMEHVYATEPMREHPHDDETKEKQLALNLELERVRHLELQQQDKLQAEQQQDNGGA